MTNQPPRRPLRHIGAAAVAVLGAALLAGAAVRPSPVAAQSTTRTETAVSGARTIQVHGVGRVSQAPDQASIVIGVETKAATAVAALNDNSAKATQLINLLKQRGIAAKDIQTAGLSVYPQYDNQGRKITGYQVSNTVTATVRDLKNAGTLIDAAAAVAGDAFRVNGLSFSISDNTASLVAARKAAVADARAVAEQLASAAGVKLGALRTVAASSASIPTPVLRSAALKTMDAASVPIEAGSQEVTAEVDLVFDIS